MSISYDKILEELYPFRDYVFYYGLSDSELTDLEQSIAQKFPDYYRDFLKLFGVRQDFVFGLLSRESDFVSAACNLPIDIRDKYVVVGDNGGEDYWLLNALDYSDTGIYEWQHWLEGDVVRMEHDFQELLNQSLSNLSDVQRKLVKNDDKSWCVQFSIKTNEEQKIYSSIPLVLSQEWTYTGISSANVHSFKAAAELGQKNIMFKRLEYAIWDSPRYFFDLREPVSQFGQYSLIKEIDAKLKAAFSGYNLIDYGILSLMDDMDA
ncbi:SMI1/KNR4 family protein [Chitinophaga pinensis]|uniref:Knr4/Smi1-like domain-containing protein n=1 Tax=Chitinophaga pinensis (strain ATCC 43595 / DSM 2588 / LMG 13176 / NBRC 15968 / NCIMB 11800 / UQM 2034) TaxID=485918 RepID=A0A979G4X5_CHIPD|nr:SMI1/KNR4 family protein [Chitinophaga pinensis]ACU60960.1 hypothetical protein Cpin_3495 [Chitinophaga pinensis DSM 2588]